MVDILVEWVIGCDVVVLILIVVNLVMLDEMLLGVVNILV